MRKILGLLLMFILICSDAYASKIGKGQIQLSETVTKNFIKFLRNEFAITFVVTPDGKNSQYGICGIEYCKGNMSLPLKWCKEKYSQKCYVFAQRKKQEKIIRWNNVNYTFPSDDWYYRGSTKNEFLVSDNKGIRQDISDDQIRSILNQFGFINFNKAVASINLDNQPKKTTNKGGEYFCVWTGKEEYAHLKWFTLNSHYLNINKLKGVKNPSDCRKNALYIVYKNQNKKLFKKLMWKFENRSQPELAQSRLTKSLFKKVQNEIPENTQNFQEQIIENTQISEIKVKSKEEKKLTQQQQIEIDQIKEMFGIGAINKEEYDAAIKRVLN